MSLKSLLAKIAVRSSIGVYVTDREVIVSKVAGTLVGPIEVSKSREAYVPEQLGAVLNRLIAPLQSRWKRFPLPVALGLAGQRVFFTTRPVKSSNAAASPEMLLHEVLQSSTISVDDMAMDVVKARPDKRPIVSIVSCRRKYLSGLLSVLATIKVNPFRAEPAPCALLRIATLQHRPPRNVKTVLRIFLGADQGLAVLTVGNVPYVWRYFTLIAGSESNSILSATRTLQTLSKPCGIEGSVDLVLVHGRPDLQPLLQSEQFQMGLGIKTKWVDGPALDESVIAFGLARGCLTEGSESFDLARSLRPRRSLWELFPWGEVALQGALILCMGLFLGNRSGHLEKSFTVVKKAVAEHVWLHSVTEQELQKEKKDLEAKVEAVRKFLATRIVWTSYARDFPARLPKHTTITGIEGMCDLEVSGKKKEGGLKQKKSFTLRLEAPIAEDGTMPKDIDEFLISMQGHPLLKKDFPTVELSDLTRYQPLANAPPLACFNVICLPKTERAAPKPDPEEKH